MIAIMIGAAAHAAEEPRAGRLDARVRFVDYEPYQVVRVAGWLRHATQVEFAPDEDVLQVAVGNAVAWEASPVGHILFLKPREHQPPTNMSVVTQKKDGTKRSYQLELATVDGDLKSKQPPFFLVKYQYPADEALRRKAEAAARAEQQKTKDAERALASDDPWGPRNWHYSIQGATSFEPSAVYDNGKITTFTFPENMTIPAIYLVHRDGTESLVPKSVRGGDARVHATGEKFVLRHGGEVLCIFNEAYVPEGIATGTMTTSSDVERMTKLRAPPAAAKPTAQTQASTAVVVAPPVELQKLQK
jgi:type IV secretion system protein VirB9